MPEEELRPGSATGGTVRTKEGGVKGQTIHLGFAVGTGAAVEIPLKHMAVTGMTQEAGKTTALEALIARSGLRAVTFITKRGEGSFGGGRRIPPFFRERADWQFVASLIDATMGEKNKLLRSWLMKVCRGTQTLAEVQRNVQTAKATARGFNESIYTEIEGYLEIVVPQLAELPPARKVVIHPGLNVMDLSPYRAELQGLVIRSVIEHVYEHENDVITVIPEAWEFLPEGRGSPVKLSAETLIRKGAALRNYIWVDAQDLGGLWKTIVRAAAVNLVGVQREANEVKRTLANLPASTPRLKPADVASLELGQFYACWGPHAIKTYVQPAWMKNSDAQLVATGAVHRFEEPHKETTVTKDEAARLTRENEQLTTDNADLRRRLEALEKGSHDTSRKEADRTAADRTQHQDASRAPAPRTATPAPGARTFTAAESLDNESLYQAIKARLIEELPGDARVMAIVVGRPELRVQVERQVIEISEDSTRGMVARLIADGFFGGGQSSAATLKELARRGQSLSPGTLYPELDKLAGMGFFRIEDGKDDRGRPRKEYHLVPGMVVNVVEK